MKKGRFLWSAHRITEKQKAGKARNIKGKQLKNSRSTVSRQPAALLSSASADFPLHFKKVLSVWAAPFFIAHSRSEIKILESADSRIFVISLKMGCHPAGSAPEE